MNGPTERRHVGPIAGRLALDDRHDLDALAARTLALFSAAAVMAAIVAVWLFRGIDSSVRLSMMAALAVLVGVLLLVYRHGTQHWPRAATLVSLLAALITNAVLATVMGVGVHGTSLGLTALLVALAGVLAGLRAAGVVAAVSVMVVMALYAMEQWGWIDGGALAATLPASNRVYTLLALIIVGLATGVVLSRVYLRSFHEATTQGDRLAALLRVGADWLWQQDAEGRLTYITEAFTDASGVPHADFIGRSWWEVPKLSVPDEGWDFMRQALRRRDGLREHVVHTLDGQGNPRVLRFNLEPRTDARGQFAGWLGVGRDVTMMVRGEHQRAELQQLLEALFRTSNDAIVLFRLPEGRVVMANDALTRVLGRSEADCIGKTTDELGVWLEQQDRERIVRGVMSSGQVAAEGARLRHADGRLVSVTVSASRFEHHSRSYMVAALRDQTEAERQRAEAAIVFEHASIGVALVRQYRFVRMNPEFEHMLGCPAGALVGQPVRALLPDDAGYEQLLSLANPALAAGRVYEGELELRRHDGSQFLARIRGQLVDPSQATQAGVVWLLEDVTERERSRRELARALEQAESANRAKSAFLATMSHEIRTPLNGTLGMIRLALETPRDDPRREEFLQHASASADTLGGIIGDVLDLSRIEAGRLQLDNTVFDLHELITNVVRAQAPLATAKGLAFESTGVEGLPRHVRGDALRVRQVLVNLLANAIKFTEQGRVVLRLVHRGEVLRIEVQDSGIGIATEVQQRLFQPFVQADAGTTRRHGGTGLGLSICRELATLMGGQVGLQHSAPDQGSRFWAELPLPAVPVHERGADAPVSAPPPLAGLQVLVVDDNPVNMLIAAETLRRWGAEVQEAADGQQALQMLQPGHGIDVVLMDMHMPQMNGAEATRALRRQPHNRQLPVIALTAAALVSEQQQAFDAGMDDFVAKPIDATLLLAALQRARSGRPDQPAAPA